MNRTTLFAVLGAVGSGPPQDKYVLGPKGSFNLLYCRNAHQSHFLNTALHRLGDNRFPVGLQRVVAGGCPRGSFGSCHFHPTSPLCRFEHSTPPITAHGLKADLAGLGGTGCRLRLRAGGGPRRGPKKKGSPRLLCRSSMVNLSLSGGGRREARRAGGSSKQKK